MWEARHRKKAEQALEPSKGLVGASVKILRQGDKKWLIIIRL